MKSFEIKHYLVEIYKPQEYQFHEFRHVARISNKVYHLLFAFNTPYNMFDLKTSLTLGIDKIKLAEDLERTNIIKEMYNLKIKVRDDNHFDGI